MNEILNVPADNSLVAKLFHPSTQINTCNSTMSPCAKVPSVVILGTEICPKVFAKLDELLVT